MKKRQKEAILLSFLQEKQKYKKLASYIVHLIRDDPSSPKESLHTIIYRLKDELRLIEKITVLNAARSEAGAQAITNKDYQERIGDLLGMRIICLRHADVEKIEAYLGFLSEENSWCSRLILDGRTAKFVVLSRPTSRHQFYP